MLIDQRKINVVKVGNENIAIAEVAVEVQVANGDIDAVRRDMKERNVIARNVKRKWNANVYVKLRWSLSNPEHSVR